MVSYSDCNAFGTSAPSPRRARRLRHFRAIRPAVLLQGEDLIIAGALQTLFLDYGLEEFDFAQCLSISGEPDVLPVFIAVGVEPKKRDSLTTFRAVLSEANLTMSAHVVFGFFASRGELAAFDLCLFDEFVNDGHGEC